VDFNTAGSSYDTTLGVYTGDSVTNLSVIAGNNNDAGSLVSSRVDFPAAAGTTYRIAVDGFAADEGWVTLNWGMVSLLGLPALNPNGTVHITFSGVNGQKYAILVSTNLETWSTQTIRTMSGSTEDYFENIEAGAKFYRTVLLP
jgi:hypothetical protein